ncbi:MAG: pseudouridine synthase [Acutalibacteraceae bacterium]
MAQIRLQKLLSERGVASRRKAEELILQGKVKVNGHPAKLGDKADDRRDVVTVCGKRLEPAEIPRYILLNKPRGYITTMSDERGRRCVAELVQDVGARVFPVGRLDKDSEGLLLMTSDGDFANAMMHPAAHVPKYYRVTLHSKVQPEQIERFCKGIELDGRMTAPARLEVLLEEPERTVIQVVLYEGRNRQIRRMCEALGWEVAACAVQRSARCGWAAWHRGNGGSWSRMRCATCCWRRKRGKAVAAAISSREGRGIPW